MKNKLNKKEILNLLKKAINIECYVEYINNYFTIDLKGEIMPEQNKNITLKSIYELMSNKFDIIDNNFDVINKKIDKLEYETNEKFKLIDKRFDKLESQTNEKFKLIDNRLKIIENIPTIKKLIK